MAMGFGFHQDRIMGKIGHLWALVGICEFHFKLFLEVVNRSLILETTAHFKTLIETSRSPRATASKQKMKNIVMMTVEFSRETMNKSLWTYPETILPINFKHLIGPQGP